MESYSLQNAPAVEREMATRTADNFAGFSVRHLQPGMCVLDCGCGPGSITLGLAKAVAPGEVVGIDVNESQVETARSLAAENNASNLRFETANIYELPFPDQSFDAIFANALLIHLSEPPKALEEMKRVLKPGGLIGIRDADRGFDLRVPTTPLLDEMFALTVRVMEHNSGSPHYARHQRELLVDAGFERVVAGAVPITYGTPEWIGRNARNTENVFRAVARTAIVQGWTDDTNVDAICDDLHAWAENLGAFGLTLWFHCVGWRPG